MPMRVLEVELSVQALQIGEILRMFKRTITSIFESRYLRNKYLQTRNSAHLGLRTCYCVSKVLFSKYALMQRNIELVCNGVILTASSINILGN